MCYFREFQLPVSYPAGFPIERNDEEEEEEEEEEEAGPPYTPRELAAIFLDFYTFLTTLHYNAANLKIAPPEGWPNITPEFCGGLKSDFAVDVLRHLPYLMNDDFGAQFHYKSELIDYTTYSPEEFHEADDWVQELGCFYSEHEENEDGIVDSIHIIWIATGRESFGRQFFLDVKHGTITEYMLRADMLDPVDVRTFFDRLKEDYQTLRLIPCLGRITIESDRVEERSSDISKEEVLAQTEDQSDSDIQYIRQIYRQHGWPDAFQAAEAMNAVDEFYGPIGGRDDAWERVDGDTVFNRRDCYYDSPCINVIIRYTLGPA
ncbi:hypothetical protein FQN49_007007 [Arthroderma sp. PD_2]|nr:hypothetical protein FQN49_007007 [Arthroderma sp. PD_2]